MVLSKALQLSTIRLFYSNAFYQQKISILNYSFFSSQRILTFNASAIATNSISVTGRL